MATDAQEQEIWSGRPSHFQAAAKYSVCVGVCVAGLAAKWFWPATPWQIPAALALIGAAGAILIWLTVQTIRFRLTTQRLILWSGLLVRKVEEIELYRIKDSYLLQPLWLRPLGLGHIVLATSDAATPSVRLEHLPQASRVRELIRTHVEAARIEKGVREVDMT